MKVVAFNGSPRAGGNTAQSLKIVLAELGKEGIETELVQLGGKRVFGCLDCGGCWRNKDRKCARTDDDMNYYIGKLFEADGILIGSPVYFSSMTPEVKALIDRGGFVAGANGGLLKRKVGAAVVAVRRAGSNLTYAAINMFFGITQMIVPGSTYWNMAFGLNPGDIHNDEEGVTTLENLGINMAWLMKRIQ
jgi:multimeric flavodoxin WrbA